MKSEKIETLDENDDILINKLNKIGYTRPIAKSIVFFLSHDKAKSLDIEKATSMRQPEVSTSMNFLRGHRLVSITTIKPIGKGRPTFLYTRCGDKELIIDFVVKQIKEKTELLNDAILILEKCKGES